MNLKDKIKSIARYEYMYFMKYPNVVGVGCGNKYINDIDTGKLSIQVYVEKKWPKGYNLSGSIPKYYQGIPTDVIESGRFGRETNSNVKANNPSPGILPVDNQIGFGNYIKIRPVKMGYSIRAYYSLYEEYGSAGCIVTRKDSRPEGDFLRFYILAANSSIAGVNKVPLLTKIAQPAINATPDDVIAVLSEYVPIKFSTPETPAENYVDAAIAEILDLNLVTPEIPFMTIPKGVDTDPQQDDLLRKSGVGSGYTAGRILSESGTFKVTYSTGDIGYFVDQILAHSMDVTNGEDVGACALNKNDEVVGILNYSSQKLTCISKIANIQKLLNVSVYTQE